MSPAQWQPDTAVASCPLCSTTFGLFTRRHHCRKCGKVVCAECSTARLHLSNPIQPPIDAHINQSKFPFNISNDSDLSGVYQSEINGTFIYRVCDKCYSIYRKKNSSSLSSPLSVTSSISSTSSSFSASSNSSTCISLPRSKKTQNSPTTPSINVNNNNKNKNPLNSSRIRRKSVSTTSSLPISSLSTLRSNNNSITNNNNTKTKMSSVGSTPTLSHQSYSSLSLDKSNHSKKTHSKEDEMNECPICGKRLEKLTSESLRVQHVSKCLSEAEFNGSPQAHHHNRMVVYRVTKSEIGKECPICLEEFEKPDLIGRLECLCFFHKKCIKDWFSRAGSGNCPVHSVHS